MHPLKTVKQWVEEYRAAGAYEPEAAVLSTRSPDSVSSRIILIRIIDDESLTFFTNLGSEKANEIRFDNKVALNFYFREQYRQVRIQGVAQAVEDSVADEYFARRSRNKQISAWASKQSSKLDSFEEFEERISFFEKKFAGCEIRRPDFWSGYKIIANSVEFWTEGQDRRHLRVLWQKEEAGGQWHSSWLYP